MRGLLGVFAATLAVLTTSIVFAQGGEAVGAPSSMRWLVVPARVDSSGASGGDSPSSDGLRASAEALREELRARGRSVWQADRSSQRFEAVGSAPAPEVSQSDIDAWVQRSRAAVRYLARADYKAARRELRAAQRLADRAAAELNREAARAQQVLDTCLFMVRAYVETNSATEAHRQARECRRLVPRVEPSAFRHTPEVRELLSEVDREMAAEAPGVLQVQSTVSRCLVRINGVELGRTPLSDIELPVGMYRLQVECEEAERGRIHRIDIASGPNRFLFDASLDHAVRTRPVLHLQYDGPAFAQRMGHAEQMAAALGGAEVLVVSASSPSSVRVDLSAEGLEPASVWLRVDGGAPGRDDLGRALDALFEGRSVDFSGPHPMARPSWEAESSSRRSTGAAMEAEVDAGASQRGGVPRPRNQRIAGWSLFAAGAASVGASLGLHLWRADLGDRFADAPASLNAAQQWQDARIAVWTTAAFGGAATSAAMPLLLPDYPRTPWWGWTLGALGLGLSGYAIYEGVTMTSCSEPYIADPSAVQSCVARGQAAGRVALALAGAAPLLTVPLVYLFRPLRAAPSVSVMREGAVVQIRTVF